MWGTAATTRAAGQQQLKKKEEWWRLWNTEEGKWLLDYTGNYNQLNDYNMKTLK